MKKIILLILIFFSFSYISSLSLNVHVPEKYVEVEPSENLYFQIDVVYPENPQRKDLRINYEIFDSKGESIVKAKVLKAIETQASFIDFIEIPESTQEGFYLINILVEDYENLNEEVVTSFNVVKKRENSFYFYIIIASLLFLGVIVVVFFFKFKRK